MQFPMTIEAGGAAITLEPDGTWSGDGEAFLAAVANMPEGEHAHPAPVLVWLVANAIQRGRLVSAGG